ncbi:MAG: HlyD family secretion protein [Vulcanococcus sp.]|uniref:HlyD family secretion protein n=1 Tax=Vulcanococcus sp. TaxID=2856995 RepID=UPI0025E32842|nr:HlyD family efflux transporter periplasmic adaptor subunit [Vulcanococcus sp.]MBW0168031.1 HlyD family secretion protein [Vulcanococcus sp.]
MSNLQRRSDIIPAQLTPLQADDFLPELGGWSKTLGQRVLAVGTVSVLALAVWPWQETVRAAGVIRPAGENTIVQSQLDGVLARVWVKDNQQVKQGEPLAELDRRSLDNERRKLEGELTQSLAQQRDSRASSLDVQQQAQATRLLNSAQRNSAQRDLDSAASTVRYRETELKRYRSLLSSGAVAETVIEEKQAQAVLARNDFAKARQAIREQEARGAAELARLGQGSNQTAREERELTKQVEQIRARLEEVKRALLNSVIKAPKSGTVIVSNLRHAQQVIRSGEVLAQIAPSQGDLQVKLSVPSSDVGNIKANQPAYLRIAGCPYPEFGVLQARVLTISADTISQSTGGDGRSPSGFQVSLQPSTKPLRNGNRRCALRHGMDVQADIVTRKTTILGFILTKLRLSTGT